MKLTYQAPMGRLTLEAEVPNAKAAFEQLAEIDEVFAETECGRCQSPLIRFDIRKVDSYRFFQLQCRACAARLDVGQHKDADTLFVKRKDDAGNLLPCRGWYVYTPEPVREEPPADPWVLLLNGAADETARRKVVTQINEEIRTGRITNGRKTSLLAAAESRKAELARRK